QRGVVHRDLKPANVLLVGGGRWTVDGKEMSSPSTVHRPPPTTPPSTGHRPPSTVFPKITDFGLANRPALGAGPTPTGVALPGPPSETVSSPTPPRRRAKRGLLAAGVGAIIFAVTLALAGKAIWPRGSDEQPPAGPGTSSQRGGGPPQVEGQPTWTVLRVGA